MARVEQLIEQIEDGALRRELEREVGLMKERLAWGLVFERHLPESTLVLNGPVKRGSIVYERRVRKPVRLRVTHVVGDELTVVPEAEPGKLSRRGWKRPLGRSRERPCLSQLESASRPTRL